MSILHAVYGTAGDVLFFETRNPADCFRARLVEFIPATETEGDAIKVQLLDGLFLHLRTADVLNCLPLADILPPSVPMESLRRAGVNP